MTQAARQPAVSSPCGSDLRIIFACPDCGQEGWILWQQLSHGMRCQACGGRFWIGQTGRLQSARQARKIRAQCPRCGQTKAVPAEFAQREFSCLGCGLSLSRVGAEGLPSGKAEKRRAPADGDPEAGLCAPGTRASRRRWGQVGGIVTAAILAAVVLLRIFNAGCGGRQPLAQVAADFTRSCLTGRAEQAVARVATGQQADFRRWMAICCRSDALRNDLPESSRLDIQVFSLSETDQQSVVRLTIRNPSRGTVLQTQHWRMEDGQWRFDATSTLQAPALEPGE